MDIESLEGQEFSYAWSEADQSTRRGMRNKSSSEIDTCGGEQNLTETIFNSWYVSFSYNFNIQSAKLALGMVISYIHNQTS